MARNFGHDLDGLVTVNLDKEAQYRSADQRAEPAGAEGIELIGHHEFCCRCCTRRCVPAGAASCRRGGVSGMALTELRAGGRPAASCASRKPQDRGRVRPCEDLIAMSAT